MGRCAAVMKRQDITPTQAFYKMMHLTNAQQHEILTEVVHKLITPNSQPLRIFLTGAAGCGKMFVCTLSNNGHL